MHSSDGSFFRGLALILLVTCVTRASLFSFILDSIFLLPALSTELGQGKVALFSAQHLSHLMLVVGSTLSWWNPILFLVVSHSSLQGIVPCPLSGLAVLGE